jgi:hypothetical protein
VTGEGRRKRMGRLSGVAGGQEQGPAGWGGRGEAGTADEGMTCIVGCHYKVKKRGCIFVHAPLFGDMHVSMWLASRECFSLGLFWALQEWQVRCLGSSMASTATALALGQALGVGGFGHSWPAVVVEARNLV